MNRAGLALLKALEGLKDGKPTTPKLDAYRDPVGNWTIGYGHLVRAGEDFAGGITQRQADELLASDVEAAATRVRRAIDPDIYRELNENQVAALELLAFNLGDLRAKAPTLVGFINGRNFDRAAEQFIAYCHAGGKVSNGLLVRRQRERALFLTPVPKPLWQSKTIWGGAISLAAWAGDQAKNLVSTLRDVAGSVVPQIADMQSDLARINEHAVALGLRWNFIGYAVAALGLVGAVLTIWGRLDVRHRVNH